MATPRDPSRLPDPADQVEWALLGLENQRRMRVTRSRVLCFYASEYPSCTPSPEELETIQTRLESIVSGEVREGDVERADEWMYLGSELRSPWDPLDERSLETEPLFADRPMPPVTSYRVYSGWVTEVDPVHGEVRHWVDEERSFETYLLEIHYRQAQGRGSGDLVVNHLLHSALLVTIDPEAASKRDAKQGSASRRWWRRK